MKRACPESRIVRDRASRRFSRRSADPLLLAAWLLALAPGASLARAASDSHASSAPIGSHRMSASADHTIPVSFAASTYTLTVSVIGGGSVSRVPDQPSYDSGTSVTLTATPADGFIFGGWGVDVVGSSNPLTLVMDGNKNLSATFLDNAPPRVALLNPTGGEVWAVGSVQAINWIASDNSGVTAVDLDYSTDGGVLWLPIATGLGDTGVYAWMVPNSQTLSARVRVTAHDAASNSALAASNSNFEIRDTGIYPIVVLRADSANGSTHYPIPSFSSPWRDLIGGHDGALIHFSGTATSGWLGNGTVASPYRLEYSGLTNEEHVLIPGHSVPQLQTVSPVSATMWFRTSFDGAQPDYRYLLEWLRPDDQGMSIAIQDLKLQVYVNPWIEVATLNPDSWYYVAVAKDTNSIQIYLNGQLAFSGPNSFMGTQQSPIAIGASIYRFVAGQYLTGEFFNGAISQVSIWRGAISGAQALAAFRADSALYLPAPPTAPVTRVVQLRADRADGTGPYPSGGAGQPWVDLAGTPSNAYMLFFNGSSGSGWEGNGAVGSPIALRFDGLQSVAKISAGSVPELALANAITAELWLKAPTDADSARKQYALEWLQAFLNGSGMSIAIASGHLQVYLMNPGWVQVAPVTHDRWYHVVVAKQPGEVRVYLNGARVYTGLTPNFGVPGTEITIGASTFRGYGQYGEFYHGSIAQFSLWQGALNDSQVTASYQADQALYADPPLGVTPSSVSFALRGLHPNPTEHDLNVWFTLPNQQPAMLELLDIGGRRVRVHEVGSLGAGSHLVSLGESRTLAAGIYLVRLTQGVHSAVSRAVILH